MSDIAKVITIIGSSPESFAKAADAAVQEVLNRWQVDAVVIPAGASPPEGLWNVLASDVDGAIYTRAP